MRASNLGARLYLMVCKIRLFQVPFTAYFFRFEKSSARNSVTPQALSLWIR